MDILTILVAEDEDFNYELMEILLAKKVRRLIRASNGAEVLTILQKEKPDLVLMDLKMPVMDGYEATLRARAIYPDLRIIALTAYTQPEDEHRAMAAGCCAFISKPIRKQELFETIRRSAK
jgi:CheY-like chemotaxis protein